MTNNIFKRIASILYAYSNNFKYCCCLFICFQVFFTACNFQNKPLSKSVTEKVLLDIVLAESYSTIVRDSAHKPGLKNIDSLAFYYNDIFAKHNITEDQLTATLNWYKNHPAELDTMCNRVLEKALALEKKK